MISVDQLEDELLGVPFPEGTFTIAPYEHWLCADAILSPELGEGVAHPMYGYYVAVTGMGISLDELFARCHSSADDGIMFGEGAIEWHGPLRIGATYTVNGGFTRIVRKESARIGVMDLITFELTVADGDGIPVAVSRNTFIYPRREA